MCSYVVPYVLTPFKNCFTKHNYGALLVQLSQDLGHVPCDPVTQNPRYVIII